MNSTQSSVIVLDSDDEEDQPKVPIATKTTKILPKPPGGQIKNIRNNHSAVQQVTLPRKTMGPASKTQNIPVSKLQNISVSKPTIIQGSKSHNSITIIPINPTSGPPPKTITQIQGSPSSRGLQITRISPKNSPRNSPKLRVNVNTFDSTSMQLNHGPANIICHKYPLQKTPSIEEDLFIDKNEFKNHNNVTSSVLNRKQPSPKPAVVNRQFKLTPANPIISKPPIINQEISRKNITNQQNLKRKIENEPNKPPMQYKRVKPTLVSTTVTTKKINNQPLNTITIDDDDDDDNFPDNKKDIILNKETKSRSSSVTSSNRESPSPGSSTSSLLSSSPKSRISSSSSSSSSTNDQAINLSKDSKTNSSYPKSVNENLNKNKVKKEDNESKDLLSSTSSPVENGNIEEKSLEKEKQEKQINEIIPAFEKLMEACRKADNSKDMETLIQKKLLKYYHSIHPDFITSKSFKKLVESITNDIIETPNLVFIKLKTIVEELKSRKNSKVVVLSNDGQTSTGNDETDELVRKLNKGLRKLKHIIAKYEEQEVDWDSDINSAYLKVERFKKRACEIYEKICDLTGESKHAQRTVRKPILFSHTSYPKINKAIETFVNKTRVFPDFHDILTIIDFCNKKYDLDLRSEEIKRIAQDAFVKVGKLLQNRRKTDLYETLSYYTEKIKDPALEDPNLSEKLNENKKHYGKINAIIQKYAREQDKAKESKIISSKCDDDLSNESKFSEKDITKNNDDNKNNSSTSIITEDIRNTPSCSRDFITKDKNLNNNQISDKSNIANTISKEPSDKTLVNNNSNNNNNNSNNNNENNNRNENCSSNEKTSNVNNHTPSIKLVNISTLCNEPSKQPASPSGINSSGINSTKSQAVASTSSSSSVSNIIFSKPKENKKQTPITTATDEVVLLDDDDM